MDQRTEDHGVLTLRLGSTIGVEASELDIDNNFNKTPANKDGAATNGVSVGALRRRLRNECNSTMSSDDGTGVMVANDECVPGGGLIVECDPGELYLVIAAPSNAPASSID